MCNGVDKEKIVLVTLFISCTKVQGSLEVNNGCDIIDVTLYTEIFLAKRKTVLLEAHYWKEKSIHILNNNIKQINDPN